MAIDLELGNFERDKFFSLGLLLVRSIATCGCHEADCKRITDFLRWELLQRWATVCVPEQNRSADDARLVEQEIPVGRAVCARALTSIWPQNNLRGYNACQGQQHLV